MRWRKRVVCSTFPQVRYTFGMSKAHPLRILVTGSRYWRDHAAVALGISGWLKSIGTSLGGAYPIPIIVHGGQRTWDDVAGEWYGADWIAGCCARTWGFGEERHPADWSNEGKGAGPKRNARMVALGADVCLAFPLGESRGTRGCMELARKAGIPVVDHDPALIHTGAPEWKP